jgi:hypothetical protein
MNKLPEAQAVSAAASDKSFPEEKSFRSRLDEQKGPFSSIAGSDTSDGHYGDHGDLR